MISMVIGIAAMTAATGAQAQHMPLAEFVKRGTALEKKGPLALMQRGEIRTLQGEVQKAALAVRNERLAAEKTGRPAAYCPPKDSAGKPVGVRELLSEMRLQQRVLPAGATLKDGWRAYAIKTYPCPRA